MNDVVLHVISESKSEVEKKELRKKAEEYLARAEQLKLKLKDKEGMFSW